ncbi:S9 family peptidase [Niabella terrae]
MKRILLLLVLLYSVKGFSQGQLSDYQHAAQLKTRLHNSVYNIPRTIYWNQRGDCFWYEKPLAGDRSVYVLVDTRTRKKEILLTLDDISSALTSVLKRPVALKNLSGRQLKLRSTRELELWVENALWRWDRTKGQLTKIKDSVADRHADYEYWGRVRDQRNGRSIPSPDRKYEAFVRDHNLYLQPFGDSSHARQISFDGTADHYYSSRIHWSPDSRKLASSRIEPVGVRKLTLIESSPADQLQPRVLTRDYPKPGDSLPQYLPVIYNLDQARLLQADSNLIRNQFSISWLDWVSDSRTLRFEYNKRGHQQYAVMELDAGTGETRTLINETSNTFIDYSGKKFRHDIEGGQEIIWASERDGWNHLYLFDGRTGRLKNQITKGAWPVRDVIDVDEQSRKIIFAAGGRESGQDPYLLHYYRIGFEGDNPEMLTPEPANHRAIFNATSTLFVDIFSRVDQAPEMVLRDISGKRLMELEKADITDLLVTGWKAPEVFHAKGRDGQTDIWGIIIRPDNFDATKKYPIIENIYAGPQGAFVPKSFSVNPAGMYELAALGFIVVQIDGMGTSYRSKAFQDIAYKNLKDAGLPDRIRWIRQAASRYPQMDTSRVGIYGTSAGGQSAAGALLFHPEFYKVGVASCGCHDNRMDKIWWNEQWMGWPIGPEYAACSNVENAYRLQGKLLLILGEIDDNVDPSSTYQLVNALIKNKKAHELVVVPGLGHSSGGDYGERKRRDFFVKHLLGTEPPAWNSY